MQTINGYTFDETKWKVKGGGGQCNTASKNGKQYFIKRLTTPKYPSALFSDDFKRQKIAECDAWFKTRNAIIKKLPGNGTGTLVKPIEYFRDGPCYYEVANMVNVDSIPYDQIWKESKINKARIMLTVAMSLSDVHNAGIVHGDLDPGNILISRAAGGNLITKLIDFTDSFFENNPPDAIMSKDFWWSPEVALYSKAGEQNPNPYKKYISCKADVFSLGIVFHQYCSKDGKPPICTKPQPWQEFQLGKKPEIDSNIEPEFKEIIESMIEIEPDKRPTMAEIHSKLSHIIHPVSHREGTPRPTPLSHQGGTPRPTPQMPQVVTKELQTNHEDVKSVLQINERKVRIIFKDGKEQIMDLSLAKKMKYCI